MIRKKKNGVEWLEFEIFSEFPDLLHGVFLRHGGVSQEGCFSLNVSKRAGDNPANVNENRNRILNLLKFEKLITAKQVHQEKIAVIDATVDAVEDFDGLVTNKKNIGLTINHADCQAAIFFDPIHQVCANVHAGWRGQVKNIYRETITKMVAVFNSKPENLLVGISPSLGPENSEFINYKTELPESFYPYQIKPTYFDLWAIARMQLEEEGILPDHIQIASINTFTNPADFFSYRRSVKEGKLTGCHATVVGMK